MNNLTLVLIAVIVFSIGSLIGYIIRKKSESYEVGGDKSRYSIVLFNDGKFAVKNNDTNCFISTKPLSVHEWPCSGKYYKDYCLLDNYLDAVKIKKSLEDNSDDASLAHKYKVIG